MPVSRTPTPTPGRPRSWGGSGGRTPPEWVGVRDKRMRGELQPRPGREPPDGQRLVGVRDRPDAGPPRQRGRPAPGDRARRPSTIGRAASGRPPAAATAAAAPGPWTRRSTGGREAGEGEERDRASRGPAGGGTSSTSDATNSNKP